MYDNPIKILQTEHSVEEVLERPTGYPKVGGSNHGSGDFSLQPQRNPYLSLTPPLAETVN